MPIHPHTTYLHDKYIDVNRFDVVTESGEVLVAEIHVTEATNQQTQERTLHPSVYLYHQGEGHLQHAAGIDTNQPTRKDHVRLVQSDATHSTLRLGYRALLEIWFHRTAFVDNMKVNGVLHHNVPKV